MKSTIQQNTGFQPFKKPECFVLAFNFEVDDEDDDDDDENEDVDEHCCTSFMSSLPLDMQ